MNKSRSSYGLLVILAAALAAGCGNSTPVAQAPSAPAATAEAAPPPTATAAPEPPPPPPKASKDKWIGTFQEDFSGDVLNAAEADAKKKAGKKDPSQTKYNAAMDKAKAASGANVVENTADTLTWSVAGKPTHTMKYEIVSGDDPTNLSIRFVKDGMMLIKIPIPVSVTFSDDNTFTFKDPFAKKADSAMSLVFRRE